MKILPAICFICAGLPLVARAAPAEAVRINTAIYVIKNGGTFSIATKGPMHVERLPTPGERWRLLTTPSKIKIGDEELEFTGETMARTGDESAASRLTVVQTPVFKTTSGRSAGMRISNPAEYFEKMPDGGFQLRQGSDDSPDTPHFDLTLTPRPTSAGAGGGYQIDCELDLAVVQSREKIPGIDLDVGKPKIATFHDTLTFEVERGKWVCLVEKSEVGDYQLLVLLRVGPDPDPDPKAAAASPKNP